MLRSCFLVFFCFVYQFALSQDKVTYEETQEAFNQIFINANNSKELLDRLELRARPQNDSIYGLVLNNLGVYFGVKSAYQEAYQYFERAMPYFENNPTRQAKTLNNISIALSKFNRFPEAIRYSNQAEQIAIQLDNPQLLGLVYGQYASCYSSMYSYKNAIEFLIKSISFWELDSKTTPDKIAIEKQKLGNLFNKTGNYTFAVSLFDEALPVLLTANKLDSYYLTMVSKAESLISLSKPKEAIELLNISLAGLRDFDNNLYDHYVLEVLGNAFIELKQPDKARKYFTQAIEVALENEMPNQLFHTFSHFAKYLAEHNVSFAEEWFLIRNNKKFNLLLEKSNLENQLLYHKSLIAYGNKNNNLQNFIESLNAAIVLQDSVYKRNNFVDVFTIQTQYQVKIKDQENVILTQKLALQETKNTKIFLSLLLLLLILAGLVFWVYFTRKWNTQKVLNIELEKVLIKEALENSKKINRIKEKQIKDKEFEILELTAITIEKEEVISNILNLLENKDNKQAMLELRKLKPSKGYWRKIVDKITLMDKAYIDELSKKNPELTKGDLEFCSLLKLNLSSKDIASILQINVESVFTKKYRLYKKLKIDHNTDINLWLQKNKSQD